jgi:hypothetical protein
VEDVHSKDVSVPMFVRPVEVHDHRLNVDVIKTMSPFKLPVWKSYLANHPDEQFANRLIDYIEHGVPIGYTGPHVSRIHTNWPSAYELRDEVEKTILYDINHNHKAFRRQSSGRI